MAKEAPETTLNGGFGGKERIVSHAEEVEVEEKGEQGGRVHREAEERATRRLRWTHTDIHTQTFISVSQSFFRLPRFPITAIFRHRPPRSVQHCPHRLPRPAP